MTSTATTGDQPASLMRWLGIAAGVIVLDQITKQLAEALLTENDPLVLLPVFNFTLRYNPGAAFSFFADESGWQRWFFVVLALGVSVFLVGWLRRLPRNAVWEALGLSLILGGAIGNLIDRLLFGHVIDFIEVYVPFLPWRLFNPWPAFNIADSAIFIGVVLLIIDGVFSAKSQERKRR